MAPAVLLSDRAVPLRAGPLRLWFEPDEAFVRYVYAGEVEVLRGVYAAVRDANWGTVPLHLDELHVDQTADAFQLTYTATARAEGIVFGWNGHLTGTADGTLRFEVEGMAHTAFRRNRIGFCVLHGAACAGHPCTVEHPDGTIESSRFPDRIAPHQPFLNVRALTHEVRPGLRATVRMEGDVFETEDQRNWTDASFKTYCTPLDRPFPVEVAAGTQIRQAVALTLDGTVPAVSDETDERVQVHVPDETVGTLPLIGLMLADPTVAFDDLARTRLRALGPAHLRTPLRLDADDLADAFHRACDQAEALEASLELAVFVPPEASFEPLQTLLAARQPQVSAWMIHATDAWSTPPEIVEAAKTALVTYAPEAPFFGGSVTNFTELNRARPAIMREAVDEAARRGVPYEAARDFVLGHVGIQLAIFFDEIDWQISDGAKKVLKVAKGQIIRDDWKRVFEPEMLEESVGQIVGDVPVE